MSDNENLWSTVLGNTETYEETDEAIDYLRKQASDLSSATNGAVFAVFDQVEDSLNIRAMQAAIGQISSEQRKLMASLQGEDALSLKNANDLYSKSDYAFEIRTERYRFRLFTMAVGPVFPVEMRVDEGAFKDIKFALKRVVGQPSKTNTIDIPNFESLRKVFETLIGSKKVVYLINRLLKMASASKES